MKDNSYLIVAIPLITLFLILFFASCSSAMATREKYSAAAERAARTHSGAPRSVGFAD